jgi:hypothetical protein
MANSFAIDWLAKSCVVWRFSIYWALYNRMVVEHEISAMCKKAVGRNPTFSWNDRGKIRKTQSWKPLLSSWRPELHANNMKAILILLKRDGL